MRKHFIAVLVFGLCVLVLSAGAQQEKPPRPEASNGQRLEIPDIISRTSDAEHRPHPWISGAKLTDAAGFTIDTEAMRLLDGPGLGDKVAAANRKGIAAFNEGTEPPPLIFQTVEVMFARSEHSSLQQIVDSAAFVAVGVVEESVGGFCYGGAGHLLRIRIDEWSGRDEIPAREEVLFFWPGGEVNIGHATIFASVSGSPEPPRVGELVVLFPVLGSESAPILFFHGSRGGIGAAAKFAHMQMQVSALMTLQVPDLARAMSFSEFSAQLDIAISRSPLR